MDNPVNRGDEPLGNPVDVEEGEPIPEDEPEPEEPDPFEERAVLPRGWRPVVYGYSGKKGINLCSQYSPGG